MLRIAICDDAPDQLALLADFTDEYLKAHKLSADIQQFSHPNALLTACEHESFHIYLLDMVMPMFSGLDVGRSVRRQSHAAQIIYATTDPSFALDAYAVNPLHYLLKPIQKDAFFAALALAVSNVNFGNEIAIIAKTKTGLHTLTAGEIACCEYKNHSAIYTLVSGERFETTTLAVSFGTYVAPLLTDGRFLSPHASFVINMNQIEKLTRDGFVLRGGAFVPVSGKQRTSVRETYLNYRLHGEVKG